MRIEVIARDKDGLPFYTGDMAGASVGLDYVLFGDTVEVKVKDDNGDLLGEWIARNVYPLKIVTATQFEDGGVTVTDDASNTYEVKNA